jgi:predicted metal-dependent TIM-barrel fold hydrolase
MVLDRGCWAGHSIYPDTKMDEERMAALVEAYGPERILINSAADWGESDPLKVPKTVERMRGRGIAEDDIEAIVWRNPIAFFAQSGKLDARALEEAPEEPGATFAGNSIQRGQRAAS